MQKYLQENLTPRGLRINICPTFSDDPEFTKAWEDTLDQCTSKLMTLLINKWDNNKITMGIEIDDLLFTLQFFLHIPWF